MDENRVDDRNQRPELRPLWSLGPHIAAVSAEPGKCRLGTADRHAAFCRAAERQGPWHEFADAAVGPSSGELLHDAAYAGEGFDAIQLASFDDGADCRGSFATRHSSLGGEFGEWIMPAVR